MDLPAPVADDVDVGKAVFGFDAKRFLYPAVVGFADEVGLFHYLNDRKYGRG